MIIISGIDFQHFETDQRNRVINIRLFMSHCVKPVSYTHLTSALEQSVVLREWTAMTQRGTQRL